MRILKEKEKYKIITDENKEYFVDLKDNSCTCPHYLYRLKRIGAECKHIIAVQEKYDKPVVDREDEILSKVKEEGKIDIIWLMEEYSEEEVQQLVDKGDLIEKEGYVSVL